jgi:hypothetical protein
MANHVGRELDRPGLDPRGQDGSCTQNGERNASGLVSHVVDSSILVCLSATQTVAMRFESDTGSSTGVPPILSMLRGRAIG